MIPLFNHLKSTLQLLLFSAQWKQSIFHQKHLGMLAQLLNLDLEDFRTDILIDLEKKCRDWCVVFASEMDWHVI